MDSVWLLCSLQSFVRGMWYEGTMRYRRLTILFNLFLFLLLLLLLPSILLFVIGSLPEYQLEQKWFTTELFIIIGIWILTQPELNLEWNCQNAIRNLVINGVLMYGQTFFRVKTGKSGSSDISIWRLIWLLLYCYLMKLKSVEYGLCFAVVTF